MPVFSVTTIIDGDTFEVTPQWKWNGETGTRVRLAGYDAIELHAHGGQESKDKLTRLISREQVEIRSAHKIDRGRLVCEVFIGNVNLADYFAKFK